MKIAHLTVTNFLGAAAMDIRTEAPVQLFVGRNGAGKSSLRDAVALALTADLGRVHLKKDAQQLIHDHGDLADCRVITADGDEYRCTISPSGKVLAKPSQDPALRFVVDAQHFAALDETDRRGFLLDLMGVKMDGPAIVERLKTRGCNPAKAERVMPLLRSGFDAASKEAKARATEARGAWRAVTGENWGSEKSKGWRAPEPPYDAEAARTLATELTHCDVAIEQWQKTMGAIEGETRARVQLQARLPALRTQAERAGSISQKLAHDEAQLAEWESDLAKTLAAAGAAPRVGTVHRLATAIAMALPAWPGQDHIASGWQEMREALDEYEAEHGPALLGKGDEKARARLPNVQRSRDLLANAVANDKRDLEAARRAQAEIDSITEQLKAEQDTAGFEEAHRQLEALKLQRADLVGKLDTLKTAKHQADTAQKKTKDAAQHATDVAAWEAVADALSPDGIPAELLAETLGPLNDRLQQSSADSGWPLVALDADMRITYGGRTVALCSESERWRAHAMLAEAIAFLSGLRLLVLDRLDVLDAPARDEALGWLDILAENGELDTALVFGTYKAVPAPLPPTIAAHWIENGVAGRLKEAA
jgi:hypothetical protein